MMDIKTRLTRCCGKPVGGYNCSDGIRCPDCFDKLEGWREIERLQEALQLIALGDELGVTKQGFANLIAKNALQQKESEGWKFYCPICQR